MRHILALHRQEGAGADVQRDKGPGDAARRQAIEQVGREVQPSGGCGDRAGRAGIDGLVAFAVGVDGLGPCGCKEAAAM